MERMSIDDPQEVKERLATRRLLILAISCIVCATVFAGVVVVLIIINNSNKRILNPEHHILTEPVSLIWTSDYLKHSSIYETWPSSINSNIESFSEQSSIGLNSYQTKITDLYSTETNNLILSSSIVTESLTSKESSLFSVPVNYSDISPTKTVSLYGTETFSSVYRVISTSQSNTGIEQITYDYSTLLNSYGPTVMTRFPSSAMTKSLMSSWITTSHVLASTELTNIPLSSELAVLETSSVPYSPRVTLPPCTDQEFKCHSGQCVPLSYQCDRYYHCEDQSDEWNCTGCLGFQCTSGLCLWRWTAQCNGVVECVDLSDEMNCPAKSGGRQCENGIWISELEWCDGVDNCYDNSDESNCSCNLRTEVQCGNGQCIRQEWVCDGYMDCDTDENMCNNCSSQQFVCDSYKCISYTDVCNGQQQCTHGEDELGCFRLQSNENSTDNGSVVGKLRGDNFNVCSTHWSSNISNELCHKLGFGDHNKTEFTPLVQPSGVYLELQQPLPNGSPINISMFNTVSHCTTNSSIFVSCQQKACGKRVDNIMVAYVAGGNLATAGKWPWVVSISYLGKPICSGALINNRWIITAGHCVARPGSYNYSQTPNYIEVLLGSTKQSRLPLPGAVKLRADKIFHHPNLTWTGFGPIYWDLALIRLEREVIYSSYIQPVCLPRGQHQLTSADSCYLSGWGHIRSNQEVMVEDLREVKMRIWSDSQCQENTIAFETAVNTNITICTGYSNGILSGCQGDSGGPLMCLDNGESWTLAGVLSSGSVACGSSSQVADRFTKVSSFTEWIDDVIHNN